MIGNEEEANMQSAIGGHILGKEGPVVRKSNEVSFIFLYPIFLGGYFDPFRISRKY